MCTLRDNLLKWDLSLLQACNSQWAKTSMGAACEPTSRFDLLRLCVILLCLKGCKFSVSNQIPCQLHFNLPVTKVVGMEEAFIFLSHAGVGSRRMYLWPKWKQETEFSGWCKCTKYNVWSKVSMKTVWNGEVRSTGKKWHSTLLNTGIVL